MSASSTSTSTKIELGSAIVIKFEPAMFCVPLIAVSPILISTEVAIPVIGDRKTVLLSRSDAFSSVALA